MLWPVWARPLAQSSLISLDSVEVAGCSTLQPACLLLDDVSGLLWLE